MTMKNFFNNIYFLIRLNLARDIYPFLLYFYVNCLLHIYFYLFNTSNFIVFGSIILSCIFYILFYKKFRKIDSKIYWYILLTIVSISIIISLFVITAGTAYAQSPEPEDLQALLREFDKRKSIFDYQMQTLISKGDHAIKYFDGLVDRVEYSTSARTFSYDVPDFTPENRKIFDEVIQTMKDDVYKDTRTLAEELPKIQAINSRLVKSGSDIGFNSQQYNYFAQIIYKFSSSNWPANHSNKIVDVN